MGDQKNIGKVFERYSQLPTFQSNDRHMLFESNYQSNVRIRISTFIDMQGFK